MVHGVTKNADLDPSLLEREVRPFGMRFKDAMQFGGGAITAMLALSAVITPFLGYATVSDFLLLFAVIFWFIARSNRRSYPLRRPMDPTDLDPSMSHKDEKQRKKAQGDGIILVGNDVVTREAVWINNDDARTHMLVFGSTGSGKTRFLLSLFYQALLLGSGVMYVDGKGDTTVFGLVFSMVRRLGREDDLLLINYLTGSKNPNAANDGSRLSNTTNPFAYGPSEQLRSLIVSLMRDSGGDDMWKGRASSLLGAVLHVLCFMRDRGDINLDIGKIREFLPLDRVLELTQRDDIPEPAMNQLRKYLLDLPGYTEEDALSGSLSPKCYEQHGYLTMQLTEVMSELSSTYSHIFGAELGEIDYKDLVYNRRILFVMLPALEKDPDALSGLGKLVVAGVRSALAPALGEKVEGSHEEVMDAKPTNSNVPFLLILDEYGYYSVKGFSVVAAQARSLGVAVIFAGQDLPSFKKGGEDEAKSVIANTNVKVFMKVEDAGETLQLALERGGEADTVVTAGHEVKGEIFSGYADNLQTRVEKRKRNNIRDLVNQKPGQGHVMFADLIVRCDLFFADPRTSAEYRINRMLMVNRPNRTLVDKISESKSIIDGLFERGGADESRLGHLELDSGLKALFNGFELCQDRDEDMNNAARLSFGMMEYKEQLTDDEFVSSLLGGNKSDQKVPGPSLEKGGNSRTKTSGSARSTTEDRAEQLLSDINESSSDSDLDEQLDSGMPFMREHFETDATIRDEAKTIFNSLTDIINANIQQQINDHPDSFSPKAQAEATPVEQLYRLEVEHGGDEELARKEAQRGMKIIDERIQYPGEPQPERIKKDVISKTIDELMKTIQTKKSED